MLGKVGRKIQGEGLFGLVEKSYDQMREKGLSVLNEIGERAKQLGFDIEILGVHYGIASERLQQIYNSVDPKIYAKFFEF